MNNTPRTTRVIGNWQPTALDGNTIHREFEQLVRHGLGYHGPFSSFNVFGPGRHQSSRQREGRPHQDNNGEDLYMIMWANKLPTDIWFHDGTKLTAQDGDVILVDNTEVVHDAPFAALSSPDRWFARVRIDKGD